MPLSSSMSTVARMPRNLRAKQTRSHSGVHYLRERMRAVIDLDKAESKRIYDLSIEAEMQVESIDCRHTAAVPNDNAVDALAERLLLLRIIGEESDLIRRALMVCVKIASQLGTPFPDTVEQLRISLVT